MNTSSVDIPAPPPSAAEPAQAAWRVVIVGAGGFGREVAWIAGLCGVEVVGFIDDSPEKASGEYAGRPLLGPLRDVLARLPAGTFFHVAIGRNAVRRAVTEQAVAAGWRPLSIIAPSAIVAPSAVIGAGCFIGANSVVSVGGSLGAGVIVNHLASIGHDVRVGDFAQICPCAGISGGCEIGEEALMGTNASVIPQKRIGARATLGAGAVAIRDLADGESLVRLR